MATIVLKAFSGELPNLPAYNLPNANAQQALFCDFAQKDLRPLKQGLLVKTMTNSVKGIYSEDGIYFFTWPIETYALKSPVIGDTFGRVYFMNANGFKAATVSTATISGGEPSSSWLVGVPTPTTAPTLTLVDRTALRGYTSVAASAIAWYELSGKRYDQAAVALTATTVFKTYTFTPPTKTAYVAATDTVAASGTPSEARLVVSFTLTDTAASRQILSVNVASGATVAASSAALPGGIEFDLTSAGQLTLTWGVYESRAYTFTVTNTWDEESGPSPASIVDVTYMQDVRVNVTLPSFTGYRPANTVRIYRTFGTTASYVRVTPTTESSTQYLDLSYSAASVGAALISADWTPPVTGMFGLTALPNGSMAAFKDNILYFSEPYRPHSWQYSMSFPLNVRGICAAAQSLIVTTASGSYLVMGNTPANMSQQLLPIPQAGVSHRSMTLIEGAVAFASNDGIVSVQGSQASMEISQRFFSRDDWRGRYGSDLASIRFAYHDGFVVAASSASALGFIVRLDEAAGTFSQYNLQTDSAFYLPLLDTLYYSVGANVYRFRAGSYHTLDWWSKDFILPKYVNFAAAYISCQGSVVVTLYAEGAQWYQFTAAQSGYYRLPSGKKSLRWSVRFQTASVVQEFALGESMSELQDV